VIKNEIHHAVFFTRNEGRGIEQASIEEQALIIGARRYLHYQLALL